MKRIGIDARLYFQTGVGVYIRNFLHFLEQQKNTEFEYYIYVMKSDSAKITFKNKNFVKREVTSKWHSLSEQMTFYTELTMDNLDLMHFTYFSYPVLYIKKFIATVHDVTPLLFKTGKASTHNPLAFEVKHNAFKFVLSNQVNNSVKLITPTKTVKEQLVEIYGHKIEDKIIPVYEGVNFELLEEKADKTLRNKYKKPFFIYVGNFYPHKNVDKLVEAFEQIKSEVELVLVGPENYFSKRLKAKTKNKNIRFHHNVNNSELIFFYQNAEALINPSLSEGFGLPIVEAAHFNMPVIASDLEVFKELLGNTYTAFNPNDVKDIQEKIERFSKTKPTVNYKELMKKYSFKEMTDKIIDIYQSL